MSNYASTKIYPNSASLQKPFFFNKAVYAVSQIGNEIATAKFKLNASGAAEDFKMFEAEPPSPVAGTHWRPAFTAESRTFSSTARKRAIAGDTTSATKSRRARTTAGCRPRPMDMQPV